MQSPIRCKAKKWKSTSKLITNQKQIMKTQTQIEPMVVFSLFEFAVINGGPQPESPTSGHSRASRASKLIVSKE